MIIAKKMKDREIFCASQASTAICLSMNIDQEASSSSSSSSSSVAIQLGGRALDRHNPVICDGRRNISSTNSLLTPPRDFSQPPNTPQRKKISSKPNKNTKLKTPSEQVQQNEERERESSHNVLSTDTLKKNSFIPTDIVTRSFAKLSDLVTPPAPAAGSSRYLLRSDSQSQFYDGPPEFEPVLDLVPAEGSKDNDIGVINQQYESSSSTVEGSSSQPTKPTTPTKQVVVLMVSLHCKGCEGKVRKHLSRMKGVTSYNIDYAAKQVTIEGDVTPMSVLASVSKLKHAKFWTSQPPTPPPQPPTPPSQSPPSTALTVASTSGTTEMPRNQLD